jgi:hypothetical protein
MLKLGRSAFGKALPWGGNLMKSAASSLLAMTAVLALAQVAPVLGATLTVNCNKGDNLQTQLDIAAPGDTIEVSGTCRGRFTISKPVTLEGGGIEVSRRRGRHFRKAGILDGQKLGTVLTVNDAEGVTLNHLTIINGDAGSAIGQNGGGINCIGICVTLNSVVLANNIGYAGGAIYFGNSGLAINNSILRNNSAVMGGGIYNADGLLTVNDSSIHDNNATYGGGIFTALGKTYITHTLLNSNIAQSGEGGGIWTSARAFSISDSAINNNTVNGGGGGGIANNHGLAVTIENSTVNGNAADFGGGIENNTAGYGSTVLISAEVKHNVSNGTSGSGGGGIWNNGQLTATMSRINSNTARLNGGGIDNVFGNGSLTDCDIKRNVAADGGGIFNEAGSTSLTLTNTTVLYNIPNQIAP